MKSDWEKPDKQISMENAADSLCGFVSACIFESEDSGYKVLEIETEDGDLFTATGVMPDVEIGEKLTASGRFMRHAVYGEQFAVDHYRRELPDDTESLRRYLSSGIIKGIGPTLADRIIDTFQDKTYEVLDAHPEKLSLVKGISERKACEIGEQFAESAQSRETMLYLQSFNLTARMALRIYQTLGKNAAAIIRKNPYILAERVSGIGFRKADEIAMMSGISPDDPLRVQGAVRYRLMEASQEGHTYLPVPALLDEVRAVLEAPEEVLQRALRDYAFDGKVFIKKEGEEERVYLPWLYAAELVSARRVFALQNALLSSLSAEEIKQREEELARLLKNATKKQEIVLSAEQEEAVLAAMRSGVQIITGGPGTGKTTIIRTLLHMLDERKAVCLLAAPTGRAAKRMTEATGQEAKTIHRLLEFQPATSEEETRQSFVRCEEYPLEADMIIIDEVSMLDVQLFQHLLEAITPGTRLLLLGDKDQLPSVGAGNVLHDLIESGCAPVSTLTQIYRQAAKSHIIVNAHRINEGESLVIQNQDTDFFLMERKDTSSALKTLVDVVGSRFPKFAKCSPIQDIQVLTPMKKGPLGTQNLNPVLQEALNPPSRSKNEAKLLQGIFREGDKVMQIRNNYDLEWQVKNRFGYPLEEGKGVFNGDVGRVSSIKEGLLNVIFDGGREVSYDYAATAQLELAYAITIHKSQGTQSPVIVMPLVSGPEVLFTRNLLYTGVTRAERYVVLIGDSACIGRMIQNHREAVRFSSLKERLQELKDEL